MDILPQTIAAMTKEEVRHLKLYLSRIETPEDRKDEQLFDYIRTKGKSYDEGKILRKLYGTNDKNAFYRLRGRLQEVICQNLAMLHEKKNDKNKLFLYVSVYHIFFDKNNFETAFYYLRKAEKLALAVENLEMLDMIYANFIKISSDLPELNPEAYIDKRTKNAESLNKLREMDQVLAAVVYRMKLSQAKGREDENTLQILSDISSKYSADNSLQKSKIFQTKIYRAVSQILLQRHSYVELEKFMATIYRQFTKAKWFDKNNHDTKLQMLVYLINSLSRNRKTEKSLQYAEELKAELENFNRLHFQKYVFFYYNALVINHSETSPIKALVALKKLEEVMRGKPNAYYDMFVQLNRGILFFKTGKFNEAIRCFVKYYTNDYYKNSDNLFKLRVASAELMMQVESKDLEGVKIRLEQVRKQFKNELEQPDAYAEKKIYEWVKLVGKYNFIYKDIRVQKELTVLLRDKKMTLLEDNQLLNYRAWMRSKLKP
ncbi:MAG: hypothetical protein V4615_01070 [Bacteroidota bacterium]